MLRIRPWKLPPEILCCWKNWRMETLPDWSSEDGTLCPLVHVRIPPCQGESKPWWGGAGEGDVGGVERVKRRIPWWRPVLPHWPCNFSRGRKQKNWVKTAKLGTMDYWFVFERENWFLIGWNYWFGGLEAWLTQQLGRSEVEEADLSLVMSGVWDFIDQRIIDIKLGLFDFLIESNRILKLEEWGPSKRKLLKGLRVKSKKKMKDSDTVTLG